MVLGWRIRAAIYRFGQALAAHKKGLPVGPFFYPSISRFMPSAFELSDLIAKALAPKPKAKSCPAGGICYQFIRESPNIFKPAEIQHVQTGGHSAVLPHTALQSVVSTSGLARSQGCCHGEQSQVCEVHIWPASLLNHLCPLTPLPSAANIRSVQIARSTHAHSVGAVSVCLAFSGTVTESLMLVMLSVLYASTSLPPFPHAAFLLRTSRAAVCKV